MVATISRWLNMQGLPADFTHAVALAAAVLILLLLAWLVDGIGRHQLAPLLEKAVQKSDNHWDDAFFHHGFFRRLFRIPPVVVLYTSADLLFPPTSFLAEFIKRLAMALLILTGVRVLNTLLLAAQDIHARSQQDTGRSIRTYMDAARIAVYFLASILVVAVLTDKSPFGVLSILGGLSVVLMLVFKDTILGFVAGMQLAAHDMIRVGDWIEMPKYGADGDVIDISIHTVKVRNWDKTISTIPAYALVTDSFKNWRGMSESGGRRIKRALCIDMQSIRFCDAATLERFGKIALLRNYITAKQAEITAYNQEHQVDESLPINGRHQTNIGVFRAYIQAYLRQHPKIHPEMTFLVRHLQPTPQGLPLEIYVFSNDQVWANYEAIQADIFDHLLAATPEFGLRIFQYPSGHDLQGMLTRQAN